MERQKRPGMIALLYFVQGLCHNVVGTIILTYPQIPNYFVLSVFDLSTIVFASKFIIAPIQEIFSSITFGRRKTWIVSCCFGMSFFLFLVSRFSDQKYMWIVAFLSIPHVGMVAAQDVALDALSLKQLKQPKKISIIQMTMTSSGNVIAGFVFLKLISKDFGSKIGFPQGIISVSTFYVGISIFVLLINLYFIFSYQQQTLQQEIHNAQQQKSFSQILKLYFAYINPDRKQCRQAIYFILIGQGIHFFTSSYSIELMKNGFSKQKVNEITTICIIPLLIFSYFLNKMQVKNTWFYQKIAHSFKFVLAIIMFCLNTSNYWALFVYSFINSLNSSLIVFLDGVIINDFPINSFSAMTISMNNSNRNLGLLTSHNLWAVGHIGYRAASFMGFIMQAFILLNFKNFQNWVKQGQTSKQQQIFELE